MTPSADPHPSAASRSAPRTLGLTGADRDELAKLGGRILGDCAACGRTVYLAHNFTRLHGQVVHVRCPTTTSSTRRASPTAPLESTGGDVNAR